MKNVFKNKNVDVKFRVRKTNWFRNTTNCENLYNIVGRRKNTKFSIYFGKLALYGFNPNTFHSLERKNLDVAR